MMNTVEFRHITKFFPGVRALDDISFTAIGGETMALVGENGAGKSTLLKILNGDYQPTSGEFLINGSLVHFDSPKQALEAGVSSIYQERQLVPELTVAENVFIGSLPEKKSKLLDFSRLYEETQQIIDTFMLGIDAREKVKNISTAHQQMIEILKVYNRDLKIIAFDEPTASLTNTEIEILFGFIRKLKEQGKVVIYVSHRMKELEQIADRIAVFKDGQLVDILPKTQADEKKLIKLMVGRDLGDIFNELDRNKHIGEDVLAAKGITTNRVQDISFTLRKGEVLGFSGLVGSGRTEVMRALFGLDRILKGELVLNGKRIECRSPEDAMDLGIALCPEDRKDQGIIPNLSVATNITVSILKKLLNKIGFVNKKEESAIVDESIKRFNIKTPDGEKKIVELSGGNQQKTIIARWLATNPCVLILDEPTKGIDVGAKSEFYKLICECSKKQIGVILISSELPEVIGLSDRIIVMKDGRITGEVGREEATEEKVLALAMLESGEM